MAPYIEYDVYKVSSTHLDLRSHVSMKRRLENPPGKPAKRLQQFKADYTDQYPTIVSSSRGIHYAHCTTCKSDFSIAASGVYDVSVHVWGPRHKARAQAATNQRSMAGFLVKRDSKQADLEHKTVSAEMKFARFVVEHNLPIAVADHVTKLLPRMFPDSEIAQKFQCSRTKTTALIKMQSQAIVDTIVDSVKDKPFTLCTDGSNDQSDKFYPIILRYVDHSGSVTSSLLQVPSVEDPKCSGENIFKLLDEQLTAHSLSWDNCLALGADNANVMSGKNNGVIGHIRHQAPHVYFAGCPCHLLHLSAKYATTCLPWPIGDRLVDIYWYLKHSAKRQGELSAMKKDHGIADVKVLKYCPTRWLSMHQCISRLLELWRVLREYFESECAGKKKVSDFPERHDRCKEFLQSASARAYCHFLNYVLQMFTASNKALQHDKPLIHKSRRILLDVYRTLLLKFLKPSAFSSGDILEINIRTPYHQMSNAEIVLGAKCRSFMEEKKLSDTKTSKVVNSARNFFQTAADYMKKNLPLSDPLLKHAEVFDLQLLPQKTFSSVQFFLDKYKCFNDSVSQDNILEEFLQLQVEQLPDAVLNEDNASKQWTLIETLKDHIGHPRFPLMATLAKTVLLIPHSNACCKRTFSHVRNIRTEFRSNMNKDTLAATCVLKEGMQGCCYDGEFSQEETRKAKSATVKFLAKWDKQNLQPVALYIV